MLSSLDHVDLCISILSMCVRVDLTTVDLCDLLQSITDTKNWYASIEDLGVDVWCIRGVDRVWRSRQNNT